MTNAEQGNNLFMVKSSRLIEQLVAHGITHAADSYQFFTQVTNQLITVSEFANARQDTEAVQEFSSLLLTIPLPYARRAGLWYRSVIDYKEARTTRAITTLERLISDKKTAPIFRARAFQSLGNIRYLSGDYATARLLYLESADYIRRENPRDAYTLAQALILHNFVQSVEGDAHRAFKELLSLEKLIESIGKPLLTATYCNNIAVDLLELGQTNEAAKYSRIACLSPFAPAYPEWKETALEIEQQTASRNIVAIAVSPEQSKRPAQPKYLLIVLQFSPPVWVKIPKTIRQRVSCNNPTIALVALVARIRAPSF